MYEKNFIFKIKSKLVFRGWTAGKLSTSLSSAGSVDYAQLSLQVGCYSYAKTTVHPQKTQLSVSQQYLLVGSKQSFFTVRPPGCKPL